MAEDKKPGAKAPEAKKKTSKAPAKTAKAASGDTGAVKVKAKGAAPTARKPLVPRTSFVKWGEGGGKWRLVDAAGQPLGRLSSLIAMILMGKDKPTYTPFSDTGDAVVVINAKEVVLTGNKWDQKVYNYHTNYPGGIKTFTARQLLEDNPERLVQWAVYGMLPKSKGHLARHWYKKLRVFPGAEHTHTAQQPEAVKLPEVSVRN